MSTNVNKSFLPAINKKTKPLYTLKTYIPEKKASDSIFLPKSKIIDRILEFQLPLKLDKLLAPRIKLKDDIEKTPPFMMSQSKKSSYTNLPGSQLNSSNKKFEGYSRQSRFETFMRPLKDVRESSPSELNLSASFSPDKKLKKYIGPQSSRSKSEFQRNNKMTSDVNQTFDVTDLKVIDSMEIDENEDIQCDMEKELVTAANSKQAKKKKGYTPLSEMVPLNLEEEKQSFFENRFKYNPQFEYNTQTFKQHFEKPHTKYLKVAKMILNACMNDFGDDELYMETTGGRLITKEETEIYFDNYIKELGLEGCLDIVFSEKTVAPTSVIHDPSGKSRVVISLPIAYREHRIMGVMNHEIGTHFIRKFNDRNQLWFKNRKKFELKPHLIIEEGLAALNQTLEHALKPNAKPYLWNSALHYYSCYMSSVLGFEALFSDLEKYIKDPVKRWKECVRVKRGILDTSQPGGMYKDQVYLRGAIEILKKRKKIDFILLHSGKITVKDLQRLIRNNVIKTENLKLPSFLKDLDEYKTALDRIAEANFIDILKL